MTLALWCQNLTTFVTLQWSNTIKFDSRLIWPRSTDWLKMVAVQVITDSLVSLDSLVVVFTYCMVEITFFLKS